MSEIVKFEDLQDRIIELRGQKVLLDADIAQIYGVETRDINKAVTNNPDKFPVGYVVELSKAEKDELVENFHRFNRLKHSTVNPKAFPEKGLYMLATILKSPQAVQATLAIIETFVSSRRNKVDAGSIIPQNATAPTATYLDKKLDTFFRKFGLEGGLWTNIRRTIMRDGAEIASGALGHGAVAVLPDLPYLQWSFEYEQSSEISEHNNAEAYLEACKKLHNMFQRFLALSKGHDDGTSGVEFSTVEERVRDILSFQNGKAERSEKWRTAFTKGQLEIQAGEGMPHYDPEPWDKQRDHFPAMDKPEKAAASNVYHFYQADSLHRHYILRELLPKHELIVI